MKTIRKFPLSIIDQQEVEMPFGSKILTADIQKKTVNMWVEVNTKEERKLIRHFEMFRTGNEISDCPKECRKYISTVFDGKFVWHVYESWIDIL